MSILWQASLLIVANTQRTFSDRTQSRRILAEIAQVLTQGIEADRMSIMYRRDGSREVVAVLKSLRGVHEWGDIKIDNCYVILASTLKKIERCQVWTNPTPSIGISGDVLSKMFIELMRQNFAFDILVENCSVAFYKEKIGYSLLLGAANSKDNELLIAQFDRDGKFLKFGPPRLQIGSLKP